MTTNTPTTKSARQVFDDMIDRLGIEAARLKLALQDPELVDYNELNELREQYLTVEGKIWGLNFASNEMLAREEGF